MNSISKSIAMWSLLLVGLLAIGYGAAGELTVTVGQTARVFSSAEIQGNLAAGQSFVALYPGLNRIAVMMRTFNRVNTHDVIFHLKKGREAEKDIFTASFNAQDVGDRQWQSFSFSPLSDSAGTTYYFYLESPQSTPGNAVAVMGQEGDPYPDGIAYMGDEPAPGDMAFKTYYAVPLQKRLDFLLTRLTADKPSLWGNRYLYIGLALAYLILGIVFLERIGRLSKTVEVNNDSPDSL